jgi:hypothetical protein
MTPAQMKLAAIRARLSGQLGHPALLAILPATDNVQLDIWGILNADVTQDTADLVQAVLDSMDT